MNPGIEIEPFTFENDGETVAAEEWHVPVRLSADGGEVLELVLTRIPGRQSQTPLIFLAGGPGESAVRALHSRLRPAFMRFRDSGDVVLAEMRGVGASDPPFMTLPADWPPPADTFTSRERMTAQLSAEARQVVHLAKVAGVDLTRFTARDMARDIATIADALGAERVNLWGYSFGAHLAMAALRFIPDRIDRTVLSGVEGPNHTFKMPSALDKALEDIADIASKQSDWRGFDLVDAVSSVIERAKREPLLVDIDEDVDITDTTHAVGPFAIQYMITRSLTDRRAFGWLPAIFRDALDENYERLGHWLARQWRRRPGNAVYYISDAASGATTERWRRIRAEASTAVLGDAANFPFPEINDTWRAPDLGDEYRAPLYRDHPVLCISGTLDSNTPAWQADDIRTSLANSGHIVVTNAAHNELMNTELEIELAARFLLGDAPADARLRAPSPPFFTTA